MDKCLPVATHLLCGVMLMAAVGAHAQLPPQPTGRLGKGFVGITATPSGSPSLVLESHDDALRLDDVYGNASFSGMVGGGAHPLVQLAASARTSTPTPTDRWTSGTHSASLSYSYRVVDASLPRGQSIGVDFTSIAGVSAQRVGNGATAYWHGYLGIGAATGGTGGSFANDPSGTVGDNGLLGRHQSSGTVIVNTWYPVTMWVSLYVGANDGVALVSGHRGTGAVEATVWVDPVITIDPDDLAAHPGARVEFASLQAVPETASAWLWIAGLAMLASRRRAGPRRPGQVRAAPAVT